MGHPAEKPRSSVGLERGHPHWLLRQGCGAGRGESCLAVREQGGVDYGGGKSAGRWWGDGVLSLVGDDLA